MKIVYSDNINLNKKRLNEDLLNDLEDEINYKLRFRDFYVKNIKLSKSCLIINLAPDSDFKRYKSNYEIDKCKSIINKYSKKWEAYLIELKKTNNIEDLDIKINFNERHNSFLSKFLG